MIKFKKYSLQPDSWSFVILCSIMSILAYIQCIISPHYSDVQKQIICDVLSIIIPILISLAICYFILPEKTREHWYIRVISYVLLISMVVPVCILITYFVDIYFHFTHPWLYYILTIAYLIVFSIYELRLYKKLHGIK